MGTLENPVELVILSRVKVAERELSEQESIENTTQVLEKDNILYDTSPIVRESPCVNEMSREEGIILIFKI